MKKTPLLLKAHFLEAEMKTDLFLTKNKALKGACFENYA